MPAAPPPTPTTIAVSQETNFHRSRGISLTTAPIDGGLASAGASAWPCAGMHQSSRVQSGEGTGGRTMGESLTPTGSGDVAMIDMRTGGEAPGSEGARPTWGTLWVGSFRPRRYSTSP